MIRTRIDKVRFAALVQRLCSWYRATGEIESQHGELVYRMVSSPVAEPTAPGARDGELDVLMDAYGGLYLVRTTSQRRVLILDSALEQLSTMDGCPDRETLLEMCDLHRDSRGKIRAKPGPRRHDDIILALGIAGEARTASMASADTRSQDTLPRASRALQARQRRRYRYLK